MYMLGTWAGIRRLYGGFDVLQEYAADIRREVHMRVRRLGCGILEGWRVRAVHVALVPHCLHGTRPFLVQCTGEPAATPIPV